MHFNGIFKPRLDHFTTSQPFISYNNVYVHLDIKVRTKIILLRFQSFMGNIRFNLGIQHDSLSIQFSGIIIANYNKSSLNPVAAAIANQFLL